MATQAAPHTTLEIAGFRPPRQARSRATLARIADATEALLTDRAPAAVTVGEVVGRAGASVGSFYARFDDKDAAIRYVQERFWAELAAGWDRYLDPGRWRGASAIAVVTDLVRMLVRVQFREAPRLRAFLIDALTRSEVEVIERTATLDRRVAERVAALIAERHPESRGPSASRRAVSGFLHVISALRDDVLMGRIPGSSPAVTSRDRIVVLTRMYAGLLGLERVPKDYSGVLRLCAILSGRADAGWRGSRRGAIDRPG